MKANNYSVLDFFCGAGGLSLGFHLNHFIIKNSFDSWKPAVETYNKNIADHCKLIDVSQDFPAEQKADVIIGGPPCQGFSSAGLRKSDDSRNSLVSHYANIISIIRPKIFVFENVEGFLTSSLGDRIIDLLRPLAEAGYLIHLRKINFANYGVPQHRKRVLAIGGLGFDPGFPNFTHYATGMPGAENVGKNLPKTPSVYETIRDLPEASTEAPGVPTDHYFKALSEIDKRRIELLKPGQTMLDLPEDLWHSTFKLRANRRVQDGTPTEKRGGAPSGIRRLIRSEPCKAITSGASSEFIHPTKNRYLTLRECAKIQTFPDSFTFIGTQSEKALLIGNAVPPHFSFILATHVRNALDQMKANQRAFNRGGLLSFVPTFAEGQSPALKTATAKVQEFLLEKEQVELAI